MLSDTKIVPTAQKSGLPYDWGRFYAEVQIVGGLFLLLWLLLFWNQLYPKCSPNDEGMQGIDKHSTPPML
jgi:hypothetical protein